MAFCIQCGKKIGDTDTFCEHCGTKQPVESQPVAATKTETTTKSETKPETKTPPATSASPAPLPSAPTPSEANPTVEPAPLPPEPDPKPKQTKPNRLWRLLLTLLILGGLSYGVYLAYADYDKQRTESASWEGFLDYGLSKLGLVKDEEPVSEQAENSDSTSQAPDADETDVPPRQEPAFLYNAQGDIVDKEDKLYLQLYREQALYYQPESKLFYKVSNDQLKQVESTVTPYYNKTYGLLIAFPKGWEKLKVSSDTETDQTTREKITYLTFKLPTADKDFADSSGRAILFGLMVVSEDYYNDLKSDPEAMQSEIVPVGKYDGRGFFAYADGPSPEDLAKRIKELPEIFESGVSFH